MVKLYGKTEPRLWVKPLRELTQETTLGYEVIEFARLILGVELYPWQQWLLIHALELLDDNVTYRFRRVIVLVGRQNGKTELAKVLAAWWLFMDSERHPDRLPPIRFKIVGTAQNLDIAREPWAGVKLWCDNDPPTEEEKLAAIPALQAATSKVSDTNGDEYIRTKSLARYEIRAAKNARGKPAARVIMDELREQTKWDAWNAMSPTTKSFWNGQLWGISNAGDSTSVVLIKQREAALEFIADWERKVDAGLMSPAEYAAQHDCSLALFEWSAPEECAPDDVDAILQSNPSIGYGAQTVEVVKSDIAAMTDAAYRTEDLCQWVTAQVDSYIDVKDWEATMVSALDVRIPHGARTVWGIDVSVDRSHTWIAAAVYDDQDRPVVSLREHRKGLMWVPQYLKALAEESGMWEVAVQSKGCPAMEFIQPLQEMGFQVHEIDGSHIGLATGRLRDRVREKRLIHAPQPLVDQAIEGGVTKVIAENEAWDRRRSMVDISGVAAITVALYGLECFEPAQPETSAYDDHDLITF
ncbi:hypothetical protein [Bifidobacterium cuniculi]|uniref:Putative phage terminase, large subunit n=1 Tax=Bifidobacterium cuniculi TaxID=1688 RepID=A0A087B4F3_9BIFI|nr:hypothetical protein [Bifidobacterium cuniculi]KFI65903.1 putative phage terminase, large subunit [Bifidobacterium cuniculi]